MCEKNYYDIKSKQAGGGKLARMMDSVGRGVVVPNECGCWGGVHRIPSDSSGIPLLPNTTINHLRKKSIPHNSLQPPQHTPIPLNPIIRLPHQLPQILLVRP